MGWGIEVNGLYLNKVRPDELSYKLEENDEAIAACRNELIALAAYHGDVYNDGEESMSIINYVARRIPEMLKELEALYCENMLIRHLIENPKDGTNDD